MTGPDEQYRLEDAAKTLEEHARTRSPELRNQLVMHYSYIAKTVALQMRGVTGNFAQVEDIVNEGIITLMDCIDKYTPSKGMKFENYAFMRIRNANIDFVRRQDWVPRRVRKTAREVTEAYNALSTELMREPTNAELGARLGISEDAVARHFAEIAQSNVLSFEELLQSALPGAPEPVNLFGKSQNAPDAGMMREELRSQLAAAIEGLTEKERLVIALYYNEHLRLHEIAKIMGVSESRISQTHTKAVKKMREHMENYLHM